MRYPFVLSVFLTTLFLLVSGTLELTQRDGEFMESPLSIGRARALWLTWRSSSCYPGLARNLLKELLQILKGQTLNTTGSGSYPGSPYEGDFSCHRSLGNVGFESKTFFSLCKGICKIHTGVYCRIKKKNRRKFLSRCKTGSTLGSVRAPTCCFYRRCLQFFRPTMKGVRRFWWRKGSVRRMLRKKGC